MRKLILAEIRAYTSGVQETDSKADIVQVHITRYLSRDRKNERTLSHAIVEDPKETNASLETDEGSSSENKLCESLSDVHLNDNLSDENVKEDVQEDDKIVESDEDISSELVGFDCFIDQDTSNNFDLMESMGLPVAFGAKRGKSRKDVSNFLIL